MSNLDTVKAYERKFMQVLNDPECETSCTSPEPVSDTALRFNFSYNDVDGALKNFKDSHGWDGLYTNHLKYLGLVLLNFFLVNYLKNDIGLVRTVCNTEW